MDTKWLLRLNPNFHFDSKRTLFCMAKEKYPLQVSLDSVLPQHWACWVPKEKPQEIPFNIIASSIEHSHLYVLQKRKDQLGSVICHFSAWQKGDPMPLSVRLYPQERQGRGGQAIGHTYQENEKKLKADSENLIVKLLSRKLRGEWKHVCRSLGVDESKLYSEEADNKGNIKETIYQCLISWKQDKGDKATFESLRAALEENGRSDLAKDIEKHEELF
ncbi:hypothetical protein HOLleu_42122 [Holothuria leucospilota]|uniref:Death domain-containing protein n=1 Tax=Holothuria leucospilota TaxID=206669 RepID=A0A9Q0YIH2_HOLLE|nr:hypothetical protein HOLleu_42122 [Holothuria leucospilota]